VIDEVLNMIGAAAVAQGAITATRLAELESELRAAAARSDFHFSVTMFGVLARKL
jgi:hypothetical protein